MHKITLITPPDKLFNNSYSFLLIYPGNDIKQQFQNAIAFVDQPFNVYYYEQDDLEHNVDWLLSVCKIVDTVIFDLDNTSSRIKTLASYIIADPKTYWLTNDTESYYNKISINQVYNLDFIQTIIGEHLDAKE